MSFQDKERQEDLSSVANQDIVDLDFLKKYLAEGHAECWTPKPAFKAGTTHGRVDFHWDF